MCQYFLKTSPAHFNNTVIILITVIILVTIIVIRNFNAVTIPNTTTFTTYYSLSKLFIHKSRKLSILDSK